MSDPGDGASPILVWLAGFGAAIVFVLWVAFTPLPNPPPKKPWVLVQASGYRVELPSAPSADTVAFGAAHVVTSIDGPNAFTVMWIPATSGVEPPAAINLALQALTAYPATVTKVEPGRTGPFASAEVRARLSNAYLHGRMLVVGRRVYLVAELTPAEAPPPDLERLLSGFNPDPSAA